MNMFNDRLSKICTEKNNRLCLGLDLDNRKLKVNTFIEGVENNDFVVNKNILILRMLTRNLSAKLSFILLSKRHAQKFIPNFLK